MCVLRGTVTDVTVQLWYSRSQNCVSSYISASVVKWASSVRGRVPLAGEFPNYSVAVCTYLSLFIDLTH